MSTTEIEEYYDATENREMRADLLFAASLVEGRKVAVDCGCGAGADIEYLLSQGFEVHGYDVEDESISRCQKRFRGNSKVRLSKSSFASFRYPEASLVVADASLFFCPPSAFETAWQKIHDCLDKDGLFCGSFLGPDDTMASEEYEREKYWSATLVLTEQEVRKLFENYEIIRFTEHRISGTTPTGVPHDWHIFSVVAQKS